jgi:queuosine precursor transporter
MIEVFIWIIAVLLITALVAVIAKKHGVEYLMGIFVALVVISNILANKIVVFLEWAVPAGLIAYSVTFFVSNIINEFYSERQARKTVMIGFLANILLVVLVFIAIRWQPASFWNNQEAFALILGNTWRIVLGSLIAYIVSQSHDVWSFNLWKKVTKGRYLWIRNLLSTILSQLIDTVIFVFIAFYGLFPVIPTIIGLFIVKVIIALLDTPFIYFVRWIYKKI